ncbi:MAG: GMP/IMP nucleotidase [Pseudomonadales bacterium]|jgi:HAD superfamily hydrolase (TIGR01509 family)
MVAQSFTEASTVLLDMDGTLLDLDHYSYFWNEYLPIRFSQIHNKTNNEATRIVHHALEKHRGTLNWYCTDFWSHEFQLDIIGLKTEISHLIAYRPETLAFMNQLVKMNKRVVLTTNAHPNVITLKNVATGLLTYVDEVVSSHDLGNPKEDQAFWHNLQSQLDFDPQKTIFVDDSSAVLNAAKRYGVGTTVHIATPSSKLPPKPCRDHPSINNLMDLLHPSMTLSITS